MKRCCDGGDQSGAVGAGRMATIRVPATGYRPDFRSLHGRVRNAPPPVRRPRESPTTHAPVASRQIYTRLRLAVARLRIGRALVDVHAHAVPVGHESVGINAGNRTFFFCTALVGQKGFHISGSHQRGEGT